MERKHKRKHDRMETEKETREGDKAEMKRKWNTRDRKDREMRGK